MVVTEKAATLELPELAGDYLNRLVETVRGDDRFTGVLLAGSGATGTMDRFSDLDTVIVCEDDHHREVLGKAVEFARSLGPLLAAFTGEHVGEPRLLICLFGPPLLHVDLKFVTVADLAHRAEDGVTVWQRGTAVADALESSTATWPTPDPQWIEDRFWAWIHYATTKIGRGELFECLDTLSALRGMVFGPLLAVRRGQRPQGMRRIESWAPDEVSPLVATLGDHTVPGCVAAVRASIDLYRRLRADNTAGQVCLHPEAEAAAVAYLEEVAEA
ncbi:MAG: nucleotidyltransferase domain-containing protein [Nocardioides sp.]|nr:nucleotidyltransferase domain-containing protein [Nocardioides sp.]